MSGREHQAASTTAARRLSPRGQDRFVMALMAIGLAIAVGGALYGFFRAGGREVAENLAAGFFIGLFVYALPFIWGVGRLVNRLAGQDHALRLRRERLYWAVSIAVAVITVAAVTVALRNLNEVERESGLDGWADCVLLGIIAGEVFLLLAGRLHAWLAWLKGPIAGEPLDPTKFPDPLAPALAELEAVRMWAGRRLRRRAAWMTPLGLAAGLALWGVFFLLTRELDVFLPIVAPVVGGLIGHVAAVRPLAGEYQHRYKTRVLPLLVARFGGLAYEIAPSVDLGRLREFHVFDTFSSVDTYDRIAGDYQGRTISIVQLELGRGLRRVFRGLVIETRLDGRFLGTTAVVADAGAFGNFRRRLDATGTRRVGLESPKFERAYEVYATDQVTARALVTPTFMERFAALAQIEGFAGPLALAQDNALVIAIPRSEELKPGRGSGPRYPDFFAPPDYDDTAFDPSVPRRLNQDIRTVLSVLDAVVALAANSPTAASSRQERRRRAKSLAPAAKPVAAPTGQS